MADGLDRGGAATWQLQQKDAEEEETQHGAEADQQALHHGFAIGRLGGGH